VEISVVYLAWAGAGPAAVERFVTSLAAHPPGTEQTLVVAWKGYEDAETFGRAQQCLAGVDHEDLVIGAEGLDLTSYRAIADRVRVEAICFLNTQSVIAGDGWLAALSGHLSSPGVGLVGATGSYESPLSGRRWPLRLLRTGRYPPFPNPHVRTNAFMLRRATMLDLWWPAVASKRAAWELESGTRSVTRQIEARGLAALVIGRDGHAYPRERWRDSRTFRVDGQPNLMVHDNRTRQYAEADARFRRRLTWLAWGDGTAAPPLDDAARTAG